jgi:hypothetical protein
MPGGKYGSVREQSLRDILRRPDVRRRRRPTRCAICNNADVIDASNVYLLHPGPLLQYVRMYVD